MRITQRMLRSAAIPGTRVKSASGKWVTAPKQKSVKVAAFSSVRSDDGIRRPTSFRKQRAMPKVRRRRMVQPIHSQGRFL